jgi:hypothetical protein
MNRKSAEKRLKEIAESIKKGAHIDEFKKEMDELLGTTMEERDRYSEATWESEYDQERSGNVE